LLVFYSLSNIIQLINTVMCHFLALRAGYDILAVYIGIVIE